MRLNCGVLVCSVVGWEGFWFEVCWFWTTVGVVWFEVFGLEKRVRPAKGMMIVMIARSA